MNIDKVYRGMRKIKNNKMWSIVLIIFNSLLLVAYAYGSEFLKALNEPFSKPIFRCLWIIFMVEIAVLGNFLLLMKIGTPIHAEKIEKRFKEGGISDKNGESPILLGIEKKGKLQKYEFYSKRIPLKEFEKRKADIEIILNVEITQMKIGKDMRHIIIWGKEKSLWDKTKMIKWDDQYLSQEDFELILGENEDGIVKINLAYTPHVLFGGESGSGKSQLLQLILYEAIKKKNTEINIIDMKNGLDYQGIWSMKCNVITEQKHILDKLEEILVIMSARRTLFLKSGATQMSEYNESVDDAEKLKRIVIAFDEVAEVFDKTGLSKEEKLEHSKIIRIVAHIARQGRAYGIHLILCTQRPSAELIDGEIRSNLGIRISGRADRILSQMILDNSIASELISSEDQGVFVMKHETLFKAYYLDEQCLE